MNANRLLQRLSPGASPLRDQGLCVVLVPGPDPRFGLCPIGELGQVIAEARVKRIPLGLLSPEGEEELFTNHGDRLIAWCGAGDPPAWLSMGRPPWISPRGEA
jgi:hypothetical protein